MRHVASGLEPRVEGAIRAFEVGHALEDYVREHHIDARRLQYRSIGPRHAIIDNDALPLTCISSRRREALTNAAQALGCKRALQPLFGEDLSRKETGVEQAVIVGPAFLRSWCAPLEQRDELVENRQIRTRLRVSDHVQGVVALDAGKDRGKTDPE